MYENEHDDDVYVRALRNVHEGSKVTVPSYVYDSIAYEWSVAVIYRVQGEHQDIYYLGDDSGCSCDWYGIGASLGDLMQFSSRRSLLSYLIKEKNNGDSKLGDLHAHFLARGRVTSKK